MEKLEKEGKIDFEKAIQNLTDVLIDPAKFAEMTKNIYDAIDEDNSGTIEVDQIEKFVRLFLRGNSEDGDSHTSFENNHEEIFKILRQNENGELTQEELGKFLNMLI